MRTAFWQLRPRSPQHPITGADPRCENQSSPDDVCAELQRLTPHWAWADYFNAIGTPNWVPINVEQPGFFTAMDKALAERDPADWAAYLRWKLLRASSWWLSKPFRDARWAISGYFSGSKGEQPRPEFCADVLNEKLGRALGNIYQQRHFTDETRRRGERMVANLKAAMADRIRQATWMTPATRSKALAKLAAMKVYLGGPDETPDLGALEVTNGPFWSNLARANIFNTHYYSALLARPVDRSQWYLLPQDVSGGADYSRNVFHYPTGKFQPPFFDPKVDDALNYGSLGCDHQVMKSPTCSTIRAANMMRREGYAIGGPRPARQSL